MITMHHQDLQICRTNETKQFVTHHLHGIYMLYYLTIKPLPSLFSESLVQFCFIPSSRVAKEVIHIPANKSMAGQLDPKQGCADSHVPDPGGFFRDTRTGQEPEFGSFLL